MKKLFLIFVFLISIFGCQSKVEGTFYISNDSQDQPSTPLRLIVNNDTIFDQDASFSDVRPDLQYIKQTQLSKGKHEIIFEVPHSDLRRTEIVDFDKDKWIFFSYDFKKPADSLKRIQLEKQFAGIKNADSTFSDFYYGRKPNLSFHLMEKEPLHH